MIYEPNTTEWPVGALVIHDADAKRRDMLMRVTGRDRATGEYATRYAYPAEQPKQWRRKTWKNDKRYLHDPARFGIEVPNDRVEGRDAASSRRVPWNDGLCPGASSEKRESTCR